MPFSMEGTDKFLEMLSTMKAGKEAAEAKAAEGPAAPEAGSPGNTRLLGWLANRIAHGVKNPEQTAAKAVAAMTPGSEEEALDTAMNVAPMGRITAAGLKEKMGRIVSYLRGTGGHLTPGGREALDNTNNALRAAEQLLDVLHPKQLEPNLILQRRWEGAGSYWADPRTIGLNLDSITKTLKQRYPGDFWFSGLLGHELGHDAFVYPGGGRILPTPANLMYQNLHSVNPGLRFDRTLQSVEDTPFGNLLKFFQEGQPLRSRAQYWRLSAPERLPQEEYFADAFAGRALKLQGHEKMPIDFSYLDGLLK